MKTSLLGKSFEFVNDTCTKLYNKNPSDTVFSVVGIFNVNYDVYVIGCGKDNKLFVKAPIETIKIITPSVESLIPEPGGRTVR